MAIDIALNIQLLQQDLAIQLSESCAHVARKLLVVL